MRGLTGRIKFDQHGLRTDFTLEIVELKKDGLLKVGTYNESEGKVNFTRNGDQIVVAAGNMTLTETPLFLMRVWQHSSRNISSNSFLSKIASLNERLFRVFVGMLCPSATTRPSKRNFTESYSEIVQGLQNKTLVVTTIIVS